VSAAARLAVALAVAGAVTAGCGDSYEAVLDSLPIALTRAPMGDGVAGDGALVALASPPGAPDPPFAMVVDTGTSLTLLAAAVPTTRTEKVGFDLLDPTRPATAPAVRGTFRGVSVLKLPLQPVDAGGIPPGGILAGDILRRYSVDFRFGETCAAGTGLCSSMTFWAHLGPDLGFLEDAGYAVLRFSLFGGGEVTAEGDPDFLGQRSPLVLPATRIVLRTCAVPDAFTPDMPIEMTQGKCCTEPDAENPMHTSGVDLSLLLDTGVGPLVLGSSAWTRVTARLVAQTGTAPVETPGVLRIATWPTQIQARWSAIPRFALVDNETGSATDPGPCVELGRARRIERVSYLTVNALATNACTQPCDNDPREPDKSQNSAAYLELTSAIPVAVIADEEPFLQGLRFDVRPEGPEVDGLIGAGALGRARVEIDYLSNSPRAVFSCELDAPRSECWAAARCPRLPDNVSEHRCFGLPPHRLAATCAPSGC
jgi:hypothetical protein